MASNAVFVNGVPGSGKTTLATALAAELGFPLVAKDAIKESLADLFSVDLPTRQIGVLASDTMWSIAGMTDGSVGMRELASEVSGIIGPSGKSNVTPNNH